jgi:hypothetical protein
MDETLITIAMPITIPSTVSDERILLLRMVSVAICTISPNSSLWIMKDWVIERLSNWAIEKPIRPPIRFSIAQSPDCSIAKFLRFES